MNVYKVSRTDDVDYDEFDAFVCIAETEEEAKNMHPSGDEDWPCERWNSGWVLRKDIKTLKIKYVGTADGPARIILASYNAG